MSALAASACDPWCVAMTDSDKPPRHPASSPRRRRHRSTITFRADRTGAKLHTRRPSGATTLRAARNAIRLSESWSSTLIVIALFATFIVPLFIPREWTGVAICLAIAVDLVAIPLWLAIWEVICFRIYHPNAPQSDVQLLAVMFEKVVKRHLLCRLGRHDRADSQAAFCSRCAAMLNPDENGVPLEWPHFEVLMRDGTRQFVRAFSVEHARSHIVYGEGAALKRPRNPTLVPFSEGGSAEPLANVHVHPAHIVSVTEIHSAPGDTH